MNSTVKMTEKYLELQESLWFVQSGNETIKRSNLTFNATFFIKVMLLIYVDAHIGLIVDVMRFLNAGIPYL